MSLKSPGKFVRRDCGLEGGHLTIIRKPIHSRHWKLLFFLVHILPAGTRTAVQMFCPVVMPSAQLGLCSDGGEALLSQVGPCSAIAEALRWWEGFGSCRHQGKMLCFHTAKMIA